MQSTGEQLVRPKSRVQRVGVEVVRDYGVVAAFALLFIILSLASPAFLSTRNLLNILDQSAPVAIIACAGTLVIIAGGFDLSAGAVFALSGVIAAKVANAVDPVVGMLAALVVATLLGVFNGLLVAGLHINPFVATFSSAMMIRGLAVVITGGFLVTVTDPAYTVIGRNSLFSVKYSVYILAAFAAVCWFLLVRTKLGRHIYAVGGNPEAARLSGIRVGWIRVLTFAISGFAAGLAGLIASSRVATGQADAGTLIEFTAIAAVVIGGTSIMGGEGTIWRTVVGVLLLALIGNGFNMLSVNPFYQDIVKGAIIVLAVAFDAWSKRRA
ncbi:ABC transporter permease [Sphaerobacter thermophilus]|uniref:Autoinducer 2 import system permease protein LsrD n=1 Tax=Sphaerobacter thermophilus (strain ATCC 49802 / DSM 20745 / KCCM 41009 / NCIMB 13125 / S 6022) TaxID=479434 RepID=D1CAQ3_SPHTD|nr:ABC transporter permease [Sphaerobacter thermophilus]ACZ40896.1 inner-membrane translocator [Sphaerobacter thermophilus DSM 20745]